MEIERKFVVPDPPADLGSQSVSEIEQGYLAVEGDVAEVRLRRSDDARRLTVKSGRGRSRGEEEVALPAEAFDRLWPLTEGRRVAKRRHRLPAGDETVEVDVYGGELEGLVVAEVEFSSEEAADAFEPPAWFGREVTDDDRYRNRALAEAGAPPPG